MGFSKLKLIKSAFIGALALLLSVFAAPGAPLAEKIAVGALRFTSHAANFVAFERGYFTEQGLEVEFKFFQAAQPMAVAIASGDLDFGVTAISGGLIHLAEKGALRVLGGPFPAHSGSPPTPPLLTARNTAPSAISDSAIQRLTYSTVSGAMNWIEPSPN